MSDTVPENDRPAPAGRDGTVPVTPAEPPPATAGAPGNPPPPVEQAAAGSEAPRVPPAAAGYPPPPPGSAATGTPPPGWGWRGRPPLRWDGRRGWVPLLLVGFIGLVIGCVLGGVAVAGLSVVIDHRQGYHHSRFEPNHRPGDRQRPPAPPNRKPFPSPTAT